MNVIFDASNHDTDGVVFDAPIDGAIVVREDGLLSASPPISAPPSAVMSLSGGYFDVRFYGTVTGSPYYVLGPVPAIELGTLPIEFVSGDDRTFSTINIGDTAALTGDIVAHQALLLRNFGSTQSYFNCTSLSADRIFNFGTCLGADLGEGDDLFRNTGRVVLDISMGGGSDRVINEGWMGSLANFGAGYFTLGDGNNHLMNSGTIDGQISSGSGEMSLSTLASWMEIYLQRWKPRS